MMLPSCDPESFSGNVTFTGPRSFGVRYGPIDSAQPSDSRAMPVVS